MTAAVILTDSNQSKPKLKNNKPAVVPLIKELQPYFKEIIVISNQPSVYLPHVRDTVRILTPYYKGKDPLSYLHASLSLAISNEVWLLNEAYTFPGIQLLEEMKTLKKQYRIQGVVYNIKDSNYLLYSLFDKSILTVLEKTFKINEVHLEAFLYQIKYKCFSEQNKKSLQT